MLLQHGFLGSKSWYSALARDLAQQTNSIVVVPNIPSFAFFTCGGCTLSSVSRCSRASPTLFLDPEPDGADRQRRGRRLPRRAAGQVRPDRSLGGRRAGRGGRWLLRRRRRARRQRSARGGDVRRRLVERHLRERAGQSDRRGHPGVPDRGAPAAVERQRPDHRPTWWPLRPGQFVGVVLANGSHVDSLIGGVSDHRLRQPAPDQARRRPATPRPSTRWPTAGSTTCTPASGQPTAPYGTYGEPDQYVVLGPTAARRARSRTGRRREPIPRHLVRGGQRQAVLLARPGEHHGGLQPQPRRVDPGRELRQLLLRQRTAVAHRRRRCCRSTPPTTSST